MVYLIIGILILFFYIFAVPSSIKGTVNAAVSYTHLTLPTTPYV